MIVEQYGLKYTRVSERDIELIRYWRNQSFIKETMQFKEYITPQMQKEWFKKINNKHNYYFIIEYNSNKIGLINCKDVEQNSKLSEGGIFIWEKKYWGTMFPALASLTMMQAVFEIFKSGDESIVTVSVNNTQALVFNKLLGYQIKETTPDGKFYKLYLTKDRYFKFCKKLIKAAVVYNNGNDAFLLRANPSDLQIDEINQYIINHKITL